MEQRIFKDMVVEEAKAEQPPKKEEQPPKMGVEMSLGEKMLTQPWIKRPKMNGRLAPAKRGLVKMLIFDSLFHYVAPMFGSEHNPVSSGALIPKRGWWVLGGGYSTQS